jgi:hypothetical protein
MINLVLPAGTISVPAGTIPEILSLALKPKSNAERERNAKFKAVKSDEELEALSAQPMPTFVATMVRESIRIQHVDALHEALGDGTLTARNAATHIPLPRYASGYQVDNAIVLIDDLKAYALRYGIAVKFADDGPANPLEALPSAPLHQARPMATAVDATELTPWLVKNSNDPDPKFPWYTAARYFARKLVIDDCTLLRKRLILASMVSQSLKRVGIFKRGGTAPPSPDTVLKAFSNVKLG